MQNDTTEYKEFLADTTRTEIRINPRGEDKEPPMIINILATTLFILGFIVVMITRPKH